jgi:hypothetical protein
MQTPGDRPHISLGLLGIEFHLVIADGQLRAVIEGIYEDLRLSSEGSHQPQSVSTNIQVKGVGADFSVLKDGNVVFSGLSAAEALGGIDALIEAGIHREKASICDIHASSVVKDGFRLLFIGSSGCGKTTLASGMSLWQGWSILGDEYAYCSFDSRSFFQEPYPLRMKKPGTRLFDQNLFKETWEIQDIYGTRSSPVPTGKLGALQPPDWAPADLLIFPHYDPDREGCLMQPLPIARLHHFIMASIGGAGLNRFMLFKELVSVLSENKSCLVEMSFGDARAATQELDKWALSCCAMKCQQPSPLCHLRAH